MSTFATKGTHLSGGGSQLISVHHTPVQVGQHREESDLLLREWWIQQVRQINRTRANKPPASNNRRDAVPHLKCILRAIHHSTFPSCIIDRFNGSFKRRKLLRDRTPSWLRDSSTAARVQHCSPNKLAGIYRGLDCDLKTRSIRLYGEIHLRFDYSWDKKHDNVI